MGHEQQNVEPSEGFCRGLHQVRRMVTLGEVGADDKGLSAELPHLFFQCLQPVPAPPPEDQVHPSRASALTVAAP